jgi:hypothetical protein
MRTRAAALEVWQPHARLEHGARDISTYRCALPNLAYAQCATTYNPFPDT